MPGSVLSWQMWPCTCCARSFRVHDSQAVRIEVGRHTSRFVVCPQCAARYRVPWPVVFDLTQLPAGDEHEHPVVRRVANLVREVCQARSDPPDGWLHVRDADLRSLAVDLRRTPERLADLLRRQQMLI